MSDIAKNLAKINERIEKAAKLAGRDPESIRLVAVSKTKPLEQIEEAIAAGQVDFGENYAQELRDKINALSGKNVRWHFIGHLQKNKLKYVVGKVDEMHSLDDLLLASEMSARAKRDGVIVKVFIEVNTGEEDSKFGVNVEKTSGIFKMMRDYPNIEVIGLMTMPPYFDDPEDVRPYYRGLREIRDAIREELGEPDVLPELSMGLSHDFEVAVEEGATRVRVGTAIFGKREYKRG